MIVTGRKICKRFHTYLRMDAYEGRVSGVYPHAVGVETPFGVVTLLDNSCTLRPFSCTLSPMKAFSALPIHDGDAVYLEKESILFPSAEFGVDVSVASDIELSLDVMVNLFIPTDMDVRMRHLLRVIETGSIEEDLSPLVLDKKINNVCQMVSPPIRKLRRALVDQDLPACAAASAEIAGCGIGGIPSSDGFFVGYLAGYAALSHALGRTSRRILSFTREMAASAAAHTSEVPAAFLLQTGEGLVDEELFQLLRCLFSDIAYANLVAHANSVAHAQETAGVDLLIGVYLSIMHYFGEIEDLAI